jgi:hypothetical protein
MTMTLSSSSGLWPGKAMLATLPCVDHRTRRRHARQELIAVFCLLLTVAIAILAFALVRREWPLVAMGGLLSLSTGINVLTQVRRRP